MRSKKTFSFDEEKDAEKLYNEGFKNNSIDYSKMYLVAKYIRQTFDYGEIRLEREIIRYCKNQDKNFNPIKEAEYIKKWVRSALNYDLRKIDSVCISQKEINIIKAIPNNKNRKLLFVILIFSKALKKGSVKRDKSKLKTSENYYIHYNNFSDIIRLSKLNNISETDLADILHEHRSYFTFYNAERELIRVNFVDINCKNEIIVNDLNNVMNYYNIVFETHRPAAYCINCGKEIKKNSNKQKYCKACAKIIKTEQQKILMRKRRSI
jgi:predicted nucleic acid-binding Zn ribbon protein